MASARVKDDEGQSFRSNTGIKVFICALFLISVSCSSALGYAADLLRSALPHGRLQKVSFVLPVGTHVEDWEAFFEKSRIPPLLRKGELEGAPKAVEYWFAIPYGHSTGEAKLVIRKSKSRDGVPTVIEVPFLISEGNYPKEEVHVDGKHVHPKKEDLLRIQRERSELGKVYRKSNPTPYWKGPFQMPVEGGVFTSPFGTQRVFNGSMQSFHQGVDLRAPTGTPILSPANGTVVLAKDLFYTGNTVILDHGAGLFTVYAHLSELRVILGQSVNPGELLGLSGASGRASGPHLHWGALWRRVKFDPVDLTQVLQ